MKTVTRITEDSDKNMLEDTYPIMIGLKQQKYDYVERMLVKELGELSSGSNNTFYSTHHQRQMKVHFEIIVSSGDQPERRSLNYIMGGNSKFGAGFVYLGNIEAIKFHSPSYRRCLSNIRSNPTFLLEFHICEMCVYRDIMFVYI